MKIIVLCGIIIISILFCFHNRFYEIEIISYLSSFIYFQVFLISYQLSVYLCSHLFVKVGIEKKYLTPLSLSALKIQIYYIAMRNLNIQFFISICRLRIKTTSHKGDKVFYIIDQQVDKIVHIHSANDRTNISISWIYVKVSRIYIILYIFVNHPHTHKHIKLWIYHHVFLASNNNENDVECCNSNER